MAHECSALIPEVMQPVAAPLGSRSKGHEEMPVGDLVPEACVIRYRRERWLVPAGLPLVAPLPPGIVGGFGSQLRRFLLVSGCIRN
ncbi:hypothetical protein [Methylobacterium sp. WSM2598]|uniref:hypothetical protein n=1 Tax=Methylobacterium sp. WSM2598 TaxID=398261 RepID=UPI0003639A0A|nr:hypothetical protein [Methylobacterium sp. WSM2598]